MLVKIQSIANIGLETVLVDVEVDVASVGFPGFTIVGLPSKAVEEARERVKTAIINSNFDFPPKKLPLIWLLLICPKMELPMIYQLP